MKTRSIETIQPSAVWRRLTGGVAVICAITLASGCVPTSQPEDDAAQPSTAPAQAQPAAPAPDPDAQADSESPAPRPKGQLLAEWQVLAQSPKENMTSPEAAKVAGELVQGYGVEGVESLLTALADPNADATLKVMITGSLAQVVDQAFVERLEGMLEADNEATTRACAMFLFSRAGGPSVVPTLLQYVDDENRRVRFGAVLGLGMAGHNTGTERLLAWYSQPDVTPDEAENIIGVFASMPSEEVAPALTSAVADTQLREDLRVNSAEALGVVGGAAAVPVLKTIAEKDSSENVKNSASAAAAAIEERLGMSAAAAPETAAPESAAPQQ